MRRKVLIMGAAGRDFHNFNVLFRDNENYEVVAFTATQIPDIEGRVYPAELAGKLYPEGIPIYAEADLEKIIKEKTVDDVVFAYSDVPHEYVMHKASIVRVFKPYSWIIGTGAYIDSVSNEMKQKALESIKQMRYGNNGYFWVNDMTNRMLMHPIKPELDDRIFIYGNKTVIL